VNSQNLSGLPLAELHDLRYGDILVAELPREEGSQPAGPFR
jgi:hypothetical protein